ncbi:PAS domain-containing protein [Nisaea sediminum]|uniref:PAS domain-containing protein n=1 Tax=Nisaea sediminum TaxID=2775867 RepID=UPI0018689C41|nr:PAS domain-containing protein [Nisaea sediminum]
MSGPERATAGSPASRLGRVALRNSTESVLGNGVLCRAFDYWTRIRNGAAMPLRRDLDPMDMGPALLPHSLLTDVDVAAGSVRHRVVGTNFAENFGRDITGIDLSEVLRGSYFDFVHGLFMLTCKEKLPVFSHSRFRWDEGRMLRTSRLMMPLSRDGRNADMAIVVQVFEHEMPPVLPRVQIFENGSWRDISEQYAFFAVDAPVL